MILTFALVTASVFGAEIGRESQIGKLQVRTVESMDDVTVFAKGGNLETRAIEVTAVLQLPDGHSTKRGKVVLANPSSLYPVRITIDTDGMKVLTLHIYELGSTMATSVQP
jgi:hypothetical protein